MTAQTGLPVEGKMYIGARWTVGQATRTIAVHSPATEELVGTVPEGTSGDAEDALAAAPRPSPAGLGGAAADRTRPHAAPALRPGSTATVKRSPSSSRWNRAKPIAQARGEVGGAIGFIEFAADNARRIEGDIIPSDNEGEEIWIRRVPYGVVVGLTAWNYPVALAGRKLGPALATGNTIVLKSHELTPLSLLEIGRLCEEAGIPAGVVNIVSGTGREVGDALVRSPLSDVITMTGSLRAGREIYAAAAESLKVIRLELGGKAPFIVMDDADIDAAVDAAIIARFTNCGQICTCNERMYLHAKIADRFLEAFVSRAAALTVGNPLGDVDLGPKISRPELGKVAAMVDEAVAGGAELLTGGHRLSGGAFAKGHWFEPDCHARSFQPGRRSCKTRSLGRSCR